MKRGPCSGKTGLVCKLDRINCILYAKNKFSRLLVLNSVDPYATESYIQICKKTLINNYNLKKWKKRGLVKKRKKKKEKITQ